MTQPATLENIRKEDPFSEDSLAIDSLAAYLKAAADPLRLEILRVLARDSFGVLELSRIFATTQPGMSHHLKILSKAGLVTSRREGNSIYYRRTHTHDNQQLLTLQQNLFGQLDNADVRTELLNSLNEIQQERAQASREFFTANANKFRQQQDLIASYEVYADHVKDFLLTLNFKKTQTALEIGPGQGEFLQVLSPLFKQIYAVDNSSNMLQQAKQLALKNQLNNVEFVLGDSGAIQLQKLHVDCVVINMVLHHTPSPADIFQHVGKILNAGGHVVITDLCRHDQQWATESCGDLWLGFDPEELSQWAAEAELFEGKNSYIALRNGFQIQIRHFFKQVKGEI